MNIRTHTCRCENRAPMQRGPRSLLTLDTNPSHPHNRGRLRALLQRCATERLLAPARRNGASEPLARIFAHPQGAGFTGSGADGLLRAILTEALTSKVGVSWVIATRHDLQSLGADVFNDETLDRYSSRLQVTETLEDSIERLEFEADVIRALDVNDGSAAGPTVLWFSSPASDADVVNETLVHWPDTNLIAFVADPWPYGPTHLVDADGPKPRPLRPVRLLSPRQAAEELRRSTSAN
ncbi:hypothetical protein ACFHW2_26035 [Actinomadura sp. LOL_016]|uniref:hypothetical protein n=1 Tax=unclassified Actinomadura TaxID=2626254 RepID=UPI003A8047DD